MKKLLILITSLLALSTAVFVGCNSGTDKTGNTEKGNTYGLRQTSPLDENEELPDIDNGNSEQPDENQDGQCPDGSRGCRHGKKRDGEQSDFRFRTPRTQDGDDAGSPDDCDDCDELPCPAPRKPRKRGHGDGNTVPIPKPEPVMPR